MASLDSPVSVNSANSGNGANSVDSVIHDIGYQRYRGPRLGRWHGVRSLYTHGMRAAFGIGRGAKAKIFPWFVVAIVLGVALVAIALRSVTGETMIGYRQFASSMTFPVMLFLAVVGPELVSRDLRDNVLPLYFSRPLGRSDYALTKYAALVSSILLLLAVPQLIIYLGAVFTRDDGFSGAMKELGDLGPGLAGAAIRAFVLAGIALVVASTTGRRAFAAAFIVAIFLITTPITGVLFAIGNSTMQELSFLANPMTLLNGVEEWLFGAEPTEPALIGDFGPVYGLTAAGLLALTIVLLLARYKKVAS